MTEKFYLNGDTVPTIPTPHDCVIKQIEYDTEYLTFKFEDDISAYDSIKSIHPSAKSLIIRIHLLDPELYVYKQKYSKLMRREIFYEVDNKKLTSLPKKPLEYISHTVGFTTLIIRLFQNGGYMFDICADFIEFEWIEK